MEKGYHNDRTPGGRPADFRSLDVYKLMLEYLEREEAASHGFSANLRDQLDRAADSILLNFGEGAGKKRGSRDRAKYYGHSRASATESLAGWDIARVRKYASAEYCEQSQDLLGRIAAMLSKMT